MSEIPEDVMALAEALRGRVFNAMHDDVRSREIIARAIMAERERCAKIADKLTFNAHELAQATEWGRGASSIAHEIVAAIRAGA